MDREKASAATEAIRQLLHKYPFGYLPNPAARQDAEREIMTIRENGPKSCEEVLLSLGGWLDILFVPEKHQTYVQPDMPNAVGRVRAIQRHVISDLSRIDAELNKIGWAAGSS